jgi:hypothetical protein
MKKGGKILDRHEGLNWSAKNSTHVSDKESSGFEFYEHRPGMLLQDHCIMQTKGLNWYMKQPIYETGYMSNYCDESQEQLI